MERATHVKTGKPWVVLRFTPRCCLGGGSGGKERMSHEEAGIVRQGQGRGWGQVWVQHAQAQAQAREVRGEISLDKRLSFRFVNVLNDNW